MTHDMISTEVSASGEIAALAREVVTSGRPRLLTENGEALAVLSPAVPRRRRTPRPKPLTRDSAIWDIVGSITTDVGSDTSDNIHAYLAEAYAAKEQ